MKIVWKRSKEKEIRRKIKKRRDFKKPINKKTRQKIKKNRDLKKIQNRRFNLNMTNKTHKSRNENLVFIKRFDERTRKFFRKVRKILKIVKINVLKRLKIIVINSTKLYCIISKITKFTELKNDFNRTTKSRILPQSNEIFANFFKCRKFLIFTTKKTESTAIFVFLTKNSTTISKNDEIEIIKISSLII